MKIKNKTFIISNYFLAIFIGIIIFTLLYALTKLSLTKPTYFYSKIKIGQGLWWAQTEKPQFWLATGLRKGTEILEVRYYPSNNNDEFEIYISLKLQGSFDKKRGQFYFNRSFIGVGSPLHLELSTVQISGTIIALSNEPFNDIYEQKNITLIKKVSGSEFQNAEIGDIYFDGAEPVFEIKSKEIYENKGEKYLRIIGNIKVKKINNQFVFGENNIVVTGKSLPLFTSRVSLQNFTIDSIK